jgi:hypothetical protein
VVVVLVLIPVYITSSSQDELGPSDVLAVLANVTESSSAVKTSTAKQTTQKQASKTVEPTALPPPPIDQNIPNSPPSQAQQQQLPLPPPIPIDQFPLVNDGPSSPTPVNGTKLKNRLKTTRKKKRPHFRKQFDDLEKQMTLTRQADSPN